MSLISAGSISLDSTFKYRNGKIKYSYKNKLKGKQSKFVGLGLWGPRKIRKIRLSSPQPIPLASSIRILHIGQLILALRYITLRQVPVLSII